MKKKFRKVTAVILALHLILSLASISSVSNAAEIDNESVSSQRDTIVSVAQNEIGVSGRPNKYTYWLGKIGGSYSYSWCATFVSWCADQAGVADLIPITASCTTGMKWFKDRNLWQNSKAYGGDYTPKAGDIVYYSDSYNQNDSSHVGIIVGTNGDYLSVIEGNSSDAVQHHTTNAKRMQTNKYVLGYGTPTYNDEPVNPPTNVWLGKNQVWYDIQDTIYLAPHADGADYYWFSVYKDDQQIVSQAIYGEYSFAANQWGYGNYSAYITAANSAGGTNSEWIDFSVVGNPSYNRVYKSSIWYDLSDTVDISVEPVCAKGQVIGIDKEGVGRVVTENCDTTFSIAASQLGIGNYSAYFSVYNGSGSIDTEWINFSIVGDATYSDVYCNKSVYRTDENVSITVDTVCAKGQVIGIDKEGVGRVITESCDNTFTISANQLGVGKYSAYFSVYNGSGGIDTKRVSFEIVGEYNSCELGNKFFAVIKNKESGNIADNINGNVVLNSEAKTSSQVWKFIRNEDNTYIIVSVKDNTVIDVNNGDNQNGTNIQTYQSNGTDAQRWYIVNNRDGYLLIPKCAITKAMDLCGAKTIEGTNFHIWENYGNPTQTFILERIDDLKDYLSLYEIGDTNLDGNIDIRDVTAIQRHICELELFTEEQLAVADTNGDGEINIEDATHLQMYLAEFDGIVLGKQS